MFRWPNGESSKPTNCPAIKNYGLKNYNFWKFSIWNIIDSFQPEKKVKRRKKKQWLGFQYCGILYRNQWLLHGLVIDCKGCFVIRIHNIKYLMKVPFFRSSLGNYPRKESRLIWNQLVFLIRGNAFWIEINYSLG